MDREHRIDTPQDLDFALLRFFQGYRRSPLRKQVEDGDALLAAADGLALGDGDAAEERAEALDCVRDIVAAARTGPRARELATDDAASGAHAATG
ncbi:MAG TPA: hypothetical protein VK875_13930 [Euzebyales bacterium]|nr:hypothetical protein [Euzebyales bacterium]